MKSYGYERNSDHAEKVKKPHMLKHSHEKHHANISLRFPNGNE